MPFLALELWFSLFVRYYVSKDDTKMTTHNIRTSQTFWLCVCVMLKMVASSSTLAHKHNHNRVIFIVLGRKWTSLIRNSIIARFNVFTYMRMGFVWQTCFPSDTFQSRIWLSLNHSIKIRTNLLFVSWWSIIKNR